MIDKLKEVFPNLMERESIDLQVNMDEYLWYRTPDNKLIGIPKDNVTEKEHTLLETFLTPFYASHPPLTKQEEMWSRLLIDGDTSAPVDRKIKTYRYVYFSLSDDSVDPLEFREAIHGLYPVNVPILWENTNEGVIIEENTLEEDTLSYNEIIEVLMSDFYMNVRLYVSSYFDEIHDAYRNYQWIKKCFHIVHQYSKRGVINYIEAIPYLIINNLDESTMEQIVASILKDTINDEELLNTIQTFLESNSNATLAAKKLYMHRNSLQYRVDKFIEKTGIDVKQFHGAVSVYLTLSLRHKLKRKT